MRHALWRTGSAALLGGAIALGALSPKPALADGAASTRTIILGAAALVAGIAIESNVAHKQALANRIVGYLPDGTPVYGDGHLVLANGQTVYPGNYGQTIACSNEQCTISGGNGSVYGYNGGYGYPNGGYGYPVGYAPYAYREHTH